LEYRVDEICQGGERARVTPWRGDPETAVVVPLPDAPLLSAGFVQHCLSTLANRGFHRVLTAALSPLEQSGFLAAGFGVEQGLRLLTMSIDDRLPPVPAGPRLGRVGRRRIAAVLEVDRSAFGEFWRFDRFALDEAVAATPSTRFRLARGADRRPVGGYAICGRSGRRGYVQRLAVHPEMHGHGLGRRLLLDGLHWMADRNVNTAWVNTQPENEAALALYRSVGFRVEPSGLAVLSTGLA
jgi:GNAT superfamily N-acetyltransferase